MKRTSNERERESKEASFLAVQGKFQRRDESLTKFSRGNTWKRQAANGNSALIVFKAWRLSPIPSFTYQSTTSFRHLCCGTFDRGQLMWVDKDRRDNKSFPRALWESFWESFKSSKSSSLYTLSAIVVPLGWVLKVRTTHSWSATVRTS